VIQNDSYCEKLPNQTLLINSSISVLMSAQQGTNIINNQLLTNTESVPNRRVCDNFSSSRSYAPECKFYAFFPTLIG
jgi:hypothetical protein